MKQLCILCLICAAAGFYYSAVIDHVGKGIHIQAPTDEKSFYHNYLDARIDQNREQLKGMENQIKQLRRQIQDKRKIISHIQKNRERLADEMARTIFHYRPDRVDRYLVMDFNSLHPQKIVLTVSE